MINVKDLNEEGLEIFHALSEVQLKTIYEPKPGLFIAESPKVIERALNAGYEPVSMLIDESERNEENLRLIELIESMRIPIYTAPHEVLETITGFKLVRGALCSFRRKAYIDVKELISDKSRIVILEDVVNPSNVGAIFRSAAALGMEAVILTNKSSDPLYRRAARVSMGSVFQIPWTVMEDYENGGLDTLRELGFKTVSFALRNNSVDINDITLKKEPKLAIIMGTEGEGLKESTIDTSDYVVKIPMSNEVDSLNVAAASAVAFWELGRNKDE